jgi:hypothetical protein
MNMNINAEAVLLIQSQLTMQLVESESENARLREELDRAQQSLEALQAAQPVDVPAVPTKRPAARKR